MAVPSRTCALAALAAALTPADGALAATVSTSRACYPQRSRTLDFSGAGFAPGARYVVRVDGTPAGAGTVAADGTVTGRGLAVPPAPRAERAVRVTIGDGVSSASALTRTTPLGARLVAAAGGRVRVAVHGFGPRVSLFVHYVSPLRRPVATVRLGTTAGPCGSLLSPPRPLFPFRASAGLWTLQVDTRASFSPRPLPPVARIALPVLALDQAAAPLARS